MRRTAAVVRRVGAAIVAASALLAFTPAVDAAPITITVDFTTDDGDSTLTGWITVDDGGEYGSPGFQALEDLAPYEFAFTDGITTWTHEDTIRDGAGIVFDALGAPLYLHLEVEDTAPRRRELRIIGIGPPPPVGAWRSARLDNNVGPSRGTYVLSAQAVVPEPTLLLLLGSGVAVAGMRYRRKS